MNRYKKANEGIRAPEEVKEKAVRPGQKRAYPRWSGAVAAALAVAIIGGIALWPGAGGGPTAGGPDQDGIAPLSDEIEPRSIPGDDDNGAALANGGAEAGAAAYSSGTHHAHALSMAVYPEMAPYPKDGDYFFGQGDSGDDGYEAYYAYQRAYDAWRESVGALRSGTDYTGLLDDFLTSSTRQFLTGAGEENRVYSPLNVYLALSMLAETTGDNSRAQILDLLQVDSIESLRERAAALWRDNYRDDGVVTSVLANSLWLADDLGYSQEVLDRLAADYYASSFSGTMGSAEYDTALHDWLNEQTRGLLSEQAEGLEFSPATVLALASTIYFKAAWDGEFAKENTKTETFHAPSGDVETDFMHRTTLTGYYWGGHFAAVRLDFQQGGSMWLILPDEGYSVDGLLDSGEAMEFLMAQKDGDWDEEKGETVGGWPGQKYLNVNLSMPRFDVSSDLDLIGGLKELGVTDIFDVSVSDFTPLAVSTGEPLYISKAQHAGRVKVDEEGCEAAAYAVFMVDCGGFMLPDEEVDFVLDRPFFFAITGESGLPLFTGVVNQP